MQNKNLAALYRNRFPENEMARKNAIWKVLAHDYLQKFIKSSGTVVDVACGYGEFINNIRAKRKIGIDLNPEAVKFLNQDVEFNECAAAKLSSVINSGADTIFTSNFLEHLPDKQSLDRFLDQVLLSLKPGGSYIILGPNLRYLPGKYWDFYDHHLGLTHLSLSEVLRLKGFHIDLCIDRFLPYTTQGSLPTHPFLVKLYLKFPFVWKFFGKQFFIVARKNDSAGVVSCLELDNE